MKGRSAGGVWSYKTAMGVGFTAISTIEVVVSCFFYRPVLSAFFAVLAAGFTVGFLRGSLPASLSMASIASCSLAGIFTLLPVDLEERDAIVLLGVGATLALLVLRRRAQGWRNMTQSFSEFESLQIAMVVLATAVMLSTASALRAKRGLPWLNQLATWGLTGGSLLLPLMNFRPRGATATAEAAYMAFAVPLLLLSVSYEMLFYATLGLVCWSWYEVECHTRRVQGTLLYKLHGEGSVRCAVYPEDVVTALIGFVLTHAAFFGTGNIASVSHFQLSSVYRFTTVFSPLLMGALLTIKIFLPIAFVACTFTAILKVNRMHPMPIYFVLVAVADIGVLQFFLDVRNTGTWLEIGNSISHFAIASLYIVFLPVIFMLAQVYMRRCQARDDSHIVGGVHSSLAAAQVHRKVRAL